MGYKFNETEDEEEKEQNPFVFLKVVKAYSEFYNMPFNDVDKEKITIFVLKVNFMNEELRQ